jgi:hypothetical protein
MWDDVRVGGAMLLLGASLLGGCGRVGHGAGSLAGTLFVSPCTQFEALGQADAPVAYDLNPTFFVAQPLTDIQRPDPVSRLSIRIQASGNYAEEADALLLGIYSSREVATSLGTPLPLGPSSNVRASLVLRRTCPRAPVQLELDGTITFQELGSAQVGVEPPVDFYVRYGESLRATLDAVVVDRRALTLGGLSGVSASPAVGGALQGDFDFEVRPSKAAQLYP